MTGPVDTIYGKVRGIRVNGVSAFLGIPYGSDTAPIRFQPPRPAPGWAGVRDCFVFGAQAPQGVVHISGAPSSSGINPADMPDLPTDTLMGAMTAIVKDTASKSPQSEDCLYLNVYTPDASPAHKRPVMVWLHGGGFALGSASLDCYDGGEICRSGDVVVVTINHRLGAPGFLYLGAFSDDFDDSGNVGMLDIVLALEWVRDNISNFGGDPDNVTVFGESGGGAKVGTLLGMPPARGYFHKAIQQSGPAVRMVERSDAIELAERTLAKLGVEKTEVHRLQTMDIRAIIAAASSEESDDGVFGRRTLRPCVDGRSLPQHPFDPTASEVSRDVPLIIGTNKDEATMFLAFDPQFGNMTAGQARQRFVTALGERGAAAFELYRARSPDDQPTYWAASLMTDQLMWLDSVRQAHRKSAQRAAPVFMYRVDWRATVAKGVLRAAHGVDMPFVFNNFEHFGRMNGDGPTQRTLAAKILQAWINFARTGDPSQPGLSWPRYEPKSRCTMIFDKDTRVISDPDIQIREFFIPA